MSNTVNPVRLFIDLYPHYRFRFKGHALERMGERSITSDDIAFVLETGYISKVEHDHKGLRYRIAGADLDNRYIDIVVELEEKGHGVVIVVTVIEC